MKLLSVLILVALLSGCAPTAKQQLKVGACFRTNGYVIYVTRLLTYGAEFRFLSVDGKRVVTWYSTWEDFYPLVPIDCWEDWQK